MKIADFKRFVIVFACAFYSVMQSNAQDTLRISLPDAEKQFTAKNLQLMAEKYNIDIARAQVLQARVYNNPNLQVVANIYNPEQKKWFDVSNATGEYIANVQQLIILAGKRNKQIKLAQTGVLMVENRFYDLLRTLRYTLHSDFYQAGFLQQAIAAYQLPIASLLKLTANYAELQAKGVITLKEVVRVKSLLYNLQTEQTALQNQLNDVEAELQLLLQNNKTWFVPETNVQAATLPSIRQYQLPVLIDSAYTNRYDLQLANNSLVYSQQNYSLQKAIAVPDLMAGAQFDKRGSFVNNATFFSLAMDLPFFNRNQGNIKAAKIAVDQSNTALAQQRLSVENEVQQAYGKALNTEKMLQAIDPNFQNDFDKLLKSITENFEKRNISLLEFTDFYDSYKQNVLQWNQLQNERIQAIESLNFSIGKPIVNL
ncbi:transporter [Niastella yeongjuensis]|uniref:Transporter n=1 Tax=Niastella yeongjuensis TaxID=354355 RepID=A0A1V9F7I1_9BACT|nr:TolC family protein [Niastella yeongjuensis]OQP54308.1 transporter [Niastella yeongjuensis]SEP30546.1 outer membrane protein, cobalt-zinc-cadmium efflux system [Niastella yeongjuensis]